MHHTNLGDIFGIVDEVSQTTPFVISRIPLGDSTLGDTRVLVVSGTATGADRGIAVMGHATITGTAFASAVESPTGTFNDSLTISGVPVVHSHSGFVEDWDGLFFQTATGTLTLIADAAYARGITKFTGRTETGTVSGTLLIDDVDVEGISAVTWNTSESTKTPTGNNTISAGSRVVLAVSGVSDYTEFEWSYHTERV